MSKTAEFMTTDVDLDNTQLSVKSGLDLECLFGLFGGIIRVDTVPYYYSRKYRITAKLMKKALIYLCPAEPRYTLHLQTV